MSSAVYRMICLQKFTQAILGLLKRYGTVSTHRLSFICHIITKFLLISQESIKIMENCVLYFSAVFKLFPYIKYHFKEIQRCHNIWKKNIFICVVNIYYYLFTNTLLHGFSNRINKNLLHFDQELSIEQVFE